MLARTRESGKCFMWQEKIGNAGASAEDAMQEIFRFLAH
ncbi:plasmid replication initiation protein [Cronobacter sakazakii]|nr:plasmid replication initiation protein [Cronobacter sakazakii]